MSEIKIYPLQPVFVERFDSRIELFFVDFANKKVYNVFNNNELVDNQKCAKPFRLSEEEFDKIFNVFKFNSESIKMPTTLAELIARKDSKEKYAEEKIENARKNQFRTDYDYGGREKFEQITQKTNPSSSSQLDKIP